MFNLFLKESQIYPLVAQFPMKGINKYKSDKFILYFLPFKTNTYIEILNYL